MKERLPKHVYKSLKNTIAFAEKLDASLADVVANAMKDWAIEKGATHFTHVFYPLTGLTAEKHDAFLVPDGDGGAMAEFSGKMLIQGEPDASSFPSGGLRATFEARGYTAWDVTSPAYLLENPNGTFLCIPTAFVSWTGEALDKKTPLLRSQQALNKQAKRVLSLFGVNTKLPVGSFAGPEQEYFLVDRNFVFSRPDLLIAGRSLFGAPSAKGQEFEDQYFGVINRRVLSFMMEVERELFKLGVPVKTRHNEVAPAQFELAPLYERSSVGSDHNLIVMETMKRVALRHDLVCLLHEKPYYGINGSGKHNNWSMATDTENLLEPGKTPHENEQFLAFLVAVIAAVDKYAELLRIGVSGPGNDHRLGANEAPPAIISVYLGEQLQDIVEQLEKGGASSSKSGGVLDLGVSILPPLAKDATDRNRTSPFAFTGNKFEFRAVGSTAAIHWPNTILNTIVAESIDRIATKLEKGGKDVSKTLAVVLKEEIKEHKKVLYSGNGYAEEWHAEAAKRGLPNLKTTVDALKAMPKKEYKDLFAKYKVLDGQEYDAREEIGWERYVKVTNIEANATVDIARNIIFPAVLSYQTRLAEAISKTQSVSKVSQKGQSALLDDVSTGASDLYQAVKVLDAAIDKANSAGSLHASAATFKDTVIPDMWEVRKIVDRLEELVDNETWPLPKYREMLFQY
jgi:glutamine synthetase